MSCIIALFAGSSPIRIFRVRSSQDILEQLTKLRDFYGPDLRNYNSLYLGQHDALNCGCDRIVWAALQAYELLDFERSYLEGCFLFLFGSVDSFLKSEDTSFSIPLTNYPTGPT